MYPGQPLYCYDKINNISLFRTVEEIAESPFVQVKIRLGTIDGRSYPRKIYDRLNLVKHTFLLLYKMVVLFVLWD